MCSSEERIKDIVEHFEDLTLEKFENNVFKAAEELSFTLSPVNNYIFNNTELMISIISLFLEIKQVFDIYVKCEDNVYDFKIFTDNVKYDTELMDKLFKIEDKLFELFENEDFNIDFLPVRYLDPDDILFDKYYKISLKN